MPSLQTLFCGADNDDCNVFRRGSSYLKPFNNTPLVIKVKTHETNLNRQTPAHAQHNQVNELIRQDIADSGNNLKPVEVHERAIFTWFSNHRKRDPVRNPVRNLFHAAPP